VGMDLYIATDSIVDQCLLSEKKGDRHYYRPKHASFICRALSDQKI
jgi:hypothetical protein